MDQQDKNTENIPYGVIYLITNNINGKVYVGQTTEASPQKRWSSHKNRSKNEKHHQYFALAIKKHGEENFTFEIIHEVLTNQDELDYWEIYYIDQYKSLDRTIGYNTRGGGARGKHTEETKEKLRLANIGKVLSEEHKEKLSLAKIGTVHTDEWKSKMSEIMTGRPLSEEHCKLISEGRIGMTFSDEHRKNISISKSGENSPTAKSSFDEVAKIRTEYASGNFSLRQLCEKYNLAENTIHAMIHNETWVDPNYSVAQAKKIIARNKKPAGERNSNAKLSQADVNKMRAEMLENKNLTDKDIAKKYNVARSSVSLIRRNKTWYDENWISINK